MVAHDVQRQHDLILLTNTPLREAYLVRQVYGAWRRRSVIERGYRFGQEEGLDMEDMRLETLERMGRLFILVLPAAPFILRDWAHLGACGRPLAAPTRWQVGPPP